ncbi:hypothetical protein EBZ80_19070, partial [bacterium]|nr:hypothetical protein [bacterium]
MYDPTVTHAPVFSAVSVALAYIVVGMSLGVSAEVAIETLPDEEKTCVPSDPEEQPEALYRATVAGSLRVNEIVGVAVLPRVGTEGDV